MEKPERNTADLLVECLIEEGVEYIFGIPGEENLALMNAIYDSPIKFITVRHEQGAAFIADVYGRLTGKAGDLATQPRSPALQTLTVTAHRWLPSPAR